MSVTGEGLTVGPATRFGEKLLVVAVTAAPTAPRSARDVYVLDPGTGPGAAAGGAATCTGCLKVG